MKGTENGPRGNYAKAYRTILNSGDLCGNEKVILIQLLDECDRLSADTKSRKAVIAQDDEFYLDTVKLAEKNDIKEQQIRRYTNKLAERGFINRSTRWVARISRIYYSINWEMVLNYDGQSISEASRVARSEKAKKGYDARRLKQLGEVIGEFQSEFTAEIKECVNCRIQGCPNDIREGELLEHFRYICRMKKFRADETFTKDALDKILASYIVPRGNVSKTSVYQFNS